MEKLYYYEKYCRLILFSFLFFSCNTESGKNQQNALTDSASLWVKPDGKDSMLLLSDRPPNLETPLKYFLEDYTPNNVFFVRWHLSGLPDAVDPDTFRLRIGGNVSKQVALSLNDLKTKFAPYTITALCQCSGNSRSFFDPKVP